MRRPEANVMTLTLGAKAAALQVSADDIAPASRCARSPRTPRDCRSEPTRTIITYFTCSNFTAKFWTMCSFQKTRPTAHTLWSTEAAPVTRDKPTVPPDRHIKPCAAYPVYRLVLVTPRHDMGRPAVVGPGWVDTYGISNAGTRTGEPAGRTERRGGADSDMEAAREPGRGRREGGWVAQAVWAGEGSTCNTW